MAADEMRRGLLPLPQAAKDYQGDIENKAKEEEKEWEKKYTLEDLKISEVGIKLPEDFPMRIETVGELMELAQKYAP